MEHRKVDLVAGADRRGPCNFEREKIVENTSE